MSNSNNIILSYPNRVDTTTTINGGSWLEDLPVLNLADKEMWKVARSTNALLASTKFTVDFNGYLRTLRCFALSNHNLSADAKVLIKLTSPSENFNLALYSESLSNPVWCKTNASVVATTYKSSYNNLTLNYLRESTYTGAHYAYQVVSLNIGDKYALSVYARAERRTSLRVFGSNAANWVEHPSATFNLATGTVTSIGGSQPAEIEHIEGTMYRCTVFGVPSAASCGISVATLDGAGTLTYTGDGISGLYVGCAQLELGDVKTTYKPTTSTISNWSLMFSSGWQSAWSLAFDDLVEWESATWWTGTAGDEYLRSPYPVIVTMPDFYAGEMISVEIDDTANADGYIQIGRLFAGGGIQPSTTASYGLQDSWRDLSTIDASESGSVWPTERRRLRSVSFVFNRLTHAEAAYTHEMQRLLGTVHEVLYVPYPDQASESQRYGFIGRMSELSAVEYPYYNKRSTAFKIEEIG